MSRVQIITLLGGIVIVSVGILLLLIRIGQKQINERNKNAIFIDHKKSNSKFLYAAYEFFSQWSITRFYLFKIKRQFEIYQPGDNRKIGEDTIKTALKVWIISLITIIFMITLGISMYSFILTLSLIYIFNSYTIYQNVNRCEMKLLHQMDLFLNLMRHNFYISGMVEEAILECIPDLKNPILIHIRKIQETLAAEDVEEAVNQYNDSVPNRFLKTFLALCVMIEKFGDRTVDGQSLLLMNFTSLKEEIAVEIRKRESINYKFSGLVWIAVAPMFTLKLIEGWATSNIEELELYYQGAYGVILSVVICLSCLFVYSLLHHMKEGGSLITKEHIILDKILEVKLINRILTSWNNQFYSRTLKINDMLRRMGETLTVKQLLLMRILYSIATMLLCFVISISIHENAKYQILHNTNQLKKFETVATDRQIKEIKKAVLKYTLLYSKEEISIEVIVEDIVQDGMIRNKLLMTMTAEEIVTRVSRYQNEYFRWWELLIILSLSAVAFFIPYWMLLYKIKVRQMQMEDEVIQFQSIILMLMYIERIAAEDILVWMENFAVVFKISITECLNHFSEGEQESLEKLKWKEPFAPFTLLVENLMICDKIGPRKAFDEVNIERNNYMQKRKQENDIYIEEKSAIGSLIAFVPFTLTLGLYLIIPFVVEGFNQLIGSMWQIKGMV